MHEVLADPDREEPWDFYLSPEPEDDDAGPESAPRTPSLAHVG